MPQVHITDISRLPLFDEISPADCTVLFDCLGCRIRRYPRDTRIRLDDELRGCVGTVIEGTVHIYKEDIWGNQTLLAYMGTGDLFGESISIGSLEPEKQGISFLCTTPALILFLPAKRILHPCNNVCPFHHQLSQNLFSLMSSKNRSLLDRIDVSSQGSVRDKILAYLSLEAQKHGQMSFHIPLRRTEMAQYLCINRSAMSRELAALKKEGLIDYERDFFTLFSADPDAD